MPLSIPYLPSFDEEGKQYVVVTPSTKGWKTYFTSKGDQLTPAARGAGEKIRFSWDAVEDRGTKIANLQFLDPVELHDAQASWYPVDNWTHDDEVMLSVVVPANVTTDGYVNGNCNVVSVGNVEVIVPANNDGYEYIELSSAVPVPSATETGYWDVDYATGAVTASATPGQAKFNLVKSEQIYRFANSLPLGNPMGVLDVDVYKVEWIHPTWILRAEVTKTSAGAGELSGWVLLFRQRTT